MPLVTQGSVASLGVKKQASTPASHVAPVATNPPANAGDVGDTGLIPGSGRSPGGENGNPLQYSCVIYILFKIIFHRSLLLQDIEYRSLRYTVGPCYLFYMQ